MVIMKCLQKSEVMKNTAVTIFIVGALVIFIIIGGFAPIFLFVPEWDQPEWLLDMSKRVTKFLNELYEP